MEKLKELANYLWTNHQSKVVWAGFFLAGLVLGSLLF